MSEPTVITATEASRAFSDLLHRVSYGGESFVIKKGQRLMACISPLEKAPVPQAKTEAEAPLTLLNLAAQFTPSPVASGDDAEYLSAIMEQFCKTPS